MSDLLQIPAQRRLSEVLGRHQRASPAHGNGFVGGGCPSGCAWGGAAGAGAERVRRWTPGPSWSHVCLSCLAPPLPPAFLNLPESRVASNDSDSEAEASDLLSPADRGAAHHLSFLQKQGSEASVEEGQGSRSGSEERLGAAAGEAGDGEGLAQRLSEYNANQCNNVAEVRLPAMRLRGGRAEAGAGQDRQPEFV